MKKLSNEQKKRLLKHLKLIFVIAILGISYVTFIKTTGLSIPCQFKILTGLECPGCGTTRVCLSLLSLNVKTAFSINPILTISIIPLIVTYIDYLYNDIIHDTGFKNWHTGLIVCVMISLIIFAIYKNIKLLFF